MKRGRKNVGAKRAPQNDKEKNLPASKRAKKTEEEKEEKITKKS